MHSLWFSSASADTARELDLAKAAGMEAVRVDLGWSTLETEGKGRYSPWLLEKADAFFAQAEARGLKVVVTFFGTPCWASTAPPSVKQDCAGAWWERGVEKYPPADAADYGDAVDFVVRRWGARMEALEVWNEPNNGAFLYVYDQARFYAPLLKAAYARSKAVRPAVKVLGGSLVYADGDFLARLYDDHAIKGHFDAIAAHPYNEGRDPDDRTLPEKGRMYSFQLGTEWLREIMVARGDGARGLWLTEVGFPTCTAGSDPWCVSPAQQAEYTVDGHRIARERWPYVKALLTYNLRNKGTDPASFEDQMGLVWRDFSPKPAYDALRTELARP